MAVSMAKRHKCPLLVDNFLLQKQMKSVFSLSLRWLASESRVTDKVTKSMNGPCVLCNNRHPSQSKEAWLNGAQTGDTVQCSGPFPFNSYSIGVAWPQWDACFPQVAVSDAQPQCRCRGARRPLSAQWAGLEQQTPTPTCTSLMHTCAQLHSSRPQGP